MPIYLYKCQDCGAILEYEARMKDDKPKGYIKPHPKKGDPSIRCLGIALRQFTIPGMFVPYADEDWVVRMPGEVHRERRDMLWRRKYGKTEAEV